MQAYLESTDVIDWHDDQIRKLAKEFRTTATDENSIAKTTFEWVRDNVQHSLDFRRCEVTCRASEVLTQRTGFCYAKSHLLAALMRANGIPTGFCYQRLSMDGNGSPYCLHGLNAVHLEQFGWYRIDARGNKDGVIAEFAPPRERLPFPIAIAGEADLPEIWPAPLPVVLTALENAQSVADLASTLPDLLLLPNMPTLPDV